MINTAIPMLFAYGRHCSKEVLCDRAFDFLEQLKAENNHIIRMWQQVGLPVETAGDSQALIQLKREYCDKKDCLRCRFGEQRRNLFHHGADTYQQLQLCNGTRTLSGCW